MKTDIFALCEGAFNRNGSLTIVNTFDNIEASRLPWRTTVGLALKYSVTSEDAGEKKMIIRFLDNMGTEILPSIPVNLNILDKQEESHLVVAVNLQNIVFTKSGQYMVSVIIDGIVFNTLSFNVISHE